MALAFRIHHPDDFPRLFAAHDEYSSVVNDLFGRVLTPDDDYYSAPWAFMPDSDFFGGFVVMTCRVPWLHGSVRLEGGKNWLHRHFEDARGKMQNFVEREDLPLVMMGPEHIQRHMCLDEEEVFTFTKDGGYPSKEDISEALYDAAVRVTCKALGWDVPGDWREEWLRQRDARGVDDIFDISKLDVWRKNGAGPLEGGSDSKRMRYTVDEQYAALDARDRVIGGEEKKDSFHDNHHRDDEDNDNDVVHQGNHVGQHQRQMGYSVDQYDTLIPHIPPVRGGRQYVGISDSYHEEKWDRMQNCDDSYDYYGYGDEDLYDDDTDTVVADENEEEEDRGHQISGYRFGSTGQHQQQYQQNWQQQQHWQHNQHNDSFYDDVDPNVIDSEDGDEQPEETTATTSTTIEI